MPQEAFIGIIYAGFSALAVIFLSGLPEGMHELEHMLAGSLLTCSPTELFVIALLYLGVGAFHFIFRKQFFLISENRARAIAEGYHVTWWDFFVLRQLRHGGHFVRAYRRRATGVCIVGDSTRQCTPRHSVEGWRLALGWALALPASLIGLMISVGLRQARLVRRSSLRLSASC